MSLIDDALKRAQAAGEGERARPADRPWIPTPMPDAGLARRRTLIRAMGIALVAGVLAGTGLWLVRREFAPDTKRSLPPGAGSGEGRSLAVATPQSTPFPTVEVQPPPAAAPAAAAPAPAIQARPTRAPAAEGQGQREGSPVARAEAPPPPAPRSQAITDGKIYAGVVTLADGAKVELGGIVWSETEPRALLNDKITGVGGYVEGFTVARIEQDRVALEKDGVTIYVSVK